ncbi:hypothetical protein DFAR_2210034 [Desulfarculales bacterium]
MPINPILAELRALGLEGMLKALEEQLSTPEAQELGFEERLGLVVDRDNPQRKPPAQKQAGQGQAPA